MKARVARRKRMYFRNILFEPKIFKNLEKLSNWEVDIDEPRGGRSKPRYP